jgi:hypothetical protein
MCTFIAAALYVYPILLFKVVPPSFSDLLSIYYYHLIKLFKKTTSIFLGLMAYTYK